MMTILLIVWGLLILGGLWTVLIIVGPAIVRRRRRAVLELMDPVRPVRRFVPYTTRAEMMAEARRLEAEFPLVRERMKK